jgi:hypothetical protein
MRKLLLNFDALIFFGAFSINIFILERIYCESFIEFEGRRKWAKMRAEQCRLIGNREFLLKLPVK